MTPKQYARAVRRGARLLDREIPGWHTRVDRSQLEMTSCTWCVLGQIYGEASCGYVDGVADLAHDVPRREQLDWTTANGFHAQSRDDAWAWHTLRALWILELDNRKGGGA